MFVDKINCKGKFRIFTRQVGEQDWNLVLEQTNLVVNTGRKLIKDLLLGIETGIVIQSFAFGTGDTAPTLSDTELESAVEYSTGNTYKAFEEYEVLTDTSVMFTGYYNSLQPTTQPVDLVEIGLFTGVEATAGIMYCRSTFDAITKTINLELKLEYTLEWN